jgi:hypothetical protein
MLGMFRASGEAIFLRHAFKQASFCPSIFSFLVRTFWLDFLRQSNFRTGILAARMG